MAATRNPSYYPGDLRQALLGAAKTEVAEAGIGAISLRSIARRAGVSHAAPHHHFGDRAGLFTALAIEGFTGLRETMESALTGGGKHATAVERLREMGVAYLDFAVREPALFDVMWRPEVCHPDDEQLQAAAGAAFAALVGAIVSAQAEGWGAGHDEQILALSAWSTVHGFSVLWRDGSIQGATHDQATPDAGRLVVTATIGAFAPAATKKARASRPIPG